MRSRSCLQHAASHGQRPARRLPTPAGSPRRAKPPDAARSALRGRQQFVGATGDRSWRLVVAKACGGKPAAARLLDGMSQQIAGWNPFVEHRLRHGACGVERLAEQDQATPQRRGKLAARDLQRRDRIGDTDFDLGQAHLHADIGGDAPVRAQARIRPPAMAWLLTAATSGFGQA